ncbi:MAG: hypothetical protein ACI8W7_000065 [Gammaproteobacteria bacterium]|jgi:hypothetical protein
MNLCLRLLVLSLPLLQGCAGAVLAAQIFPTIIGVGSVAGSGDRSPFRIDIPAAEKRADYKLAELDKQLHQAACGDPQSQFWLASALQNNFNTEPNSIEIYKWYRLAEIGKFAPATARLAALNDTMSVSEIAQAAARAEVWRPLTEGCSVGS